MKKLEKNVLKIGMIMLGLLLFLFPIQSFAWNDYHFYCYDDSMCQGILGPGYFDHTQRPYGAGDIFKSAAGVWHSMNKNGSAWLQSQPFITDGYRYVEPEYTNGRWPHTGLETVDNVGAVCVGHHAVGGGSGYRISLVVDTNENNTSIREQKLGYIAYMSTTNGETGRVPSWKNLIRGWVWDNNESYGGRIQRIRNNDNNPDYYGDYNNRIYWNTDVGADNYAKTVVNQKFKSNSPEKGEGAKQTIEYSEEGHTFIGPYNLQAEFGTITRAVIYTRDGNMQETEFCSKDGKNIEHISAASSYNGNNFYIVVKDIEVDSVERIMLYKKMNVIESRIAVAENATGYQHATIFYGQRREKEKDMKLPGVPFTNIKIIKNDKDSKQPLANVGFMVYNETEKKWVQDGVPAKYVDNKNEATIYRTEANGQVIIRNLNKKGIYKIYEVQNPNFGYVETSQSKPCQTIEVNVAAVGQIVNLNIENQRRYVKISGYVWEDRPNNNKESKTNGLYDNNGIDQRLKNVTVILRKANGQEIDRRVTNTITNTNNQTENGAYLFGDYQRDKTAKKIEISDLRGAYIEFEYNGMCYKSIELKPSIDNGSKASDDKLRPKFNENYQTITKGKAQNGNYNLNYEQADYKSTLLYGGNYLYGYDNQKYPIAGIDKQYLLIANTKDANPNYLLGQSTYTINDIYQGIDQGKGYKEGIEEIKNINLGVKEREMPDISLVQDIDNAKVGLNGYTHTYYYNKRFQSLEQQIEEFKKKNPDNNQIFNIGVNFGTKFGPNSYTTTIYSSDVVYDEIAEKGKLQVFITYKIKLTNEAGGINTVVNELYNYFDKDYSIYSIKEGNKTYTLENKDYEEDEVDGRKRVKIHPKDGIKIQKNKNKEIEITYQLNDNAIVKLLQQEKTLDSITEVVSYSSYDDNNFKNKYAGIDRDSAPGNTILDNMNTYEDDVDKAPTLVLKSDAQRKITGTVWNEEAIEALTKKEGYDKERIGDGQYDKNNENVVKDVKVELLKLETDENNNIIQMLPAYLYQTEGEGNERKSNQEPIEATKMTDEKGYYEFEGIIPGEYIIRFTYKNTSVLYDINGNKLQNLEEAEGGVEYYKSTLYRTTKEGAANTNSIDYESPYWYAKDAYPDLENPANSKKDRLSDARDNETLRKKRTSEGTITYSTASKTSTMKEIYADTSRMSIRMDCNVTKDELNHIDKNTSSTPDDTLRYDFSCIDFGIIRRPEQELKVSKEISYVEVILANGQKIISGDPRKDDIKHLKFLPNGNVHIELDNEIIQGATLRVKYDITVDNSGCEIDYNEESYYDFGRVKDKEKNWKIATVTDLFDYPNSGLNFNKDNNLNEKGEPIWDYLKLENLEEGRLAEGIEDILKTYNVILHTKEFATMKPGDKAVTKSMTLTRLLANMNEDFSFDNDIEINTYDGRKMDYTIPGNYNPTDSSTSENDDDSKNMVITGPTGEDQNILPYIITRNYITNFINHGYYYH